MEKSTQWSRISHEQAFLLNITETAWDQKAAMNGLQEAWRTIPKHHFKKCCLRELLRNKGGHIEYWLLSSLELSQLLAYTLYMFEHFNEALHPFSNSIKA